MMGTRFAVVGAMAVLLGVLLSGCDIKADIRLTDDPLGGTDPGVLDETADENVVAYFYAGKPVKGLLYSCSRSSVVEYSGQTDINGRFVCPRDNTASFFVGVAGVETIKLGQVELSIFGLPTSPGKRTSVVITPSTLYGTSVSGSKREVSNSFNLLHSLDVMFLGSGRLQAIIDLDPIMMASAVQSEAFHDLVADRISASPSLFDTHLKALVAELEPVFNFTLANSRPAEPTLGIVESVDVANAALLRARAGLYRNNSTILDSQTGQVFLGAAEFMVGADGVVAGHVISEEYSTLSSSSLYLLNVLEVAPTARVTPDGALQGFSFGSGIRKLDLFGTLVNDSVWGEGRLCQPDSPNEYVPAIYCTALVGDGGFSISDVGTFESALGFDGDLYLGQPINNKPDIELDNLPVDYLPRTFELELSRYTGITFGNFTSSDHDAVGDDKTAFGALEVLPGKVRYTLLPNGDIVSDVDTDCSKLSVVSGRYVDEDGSREYLIGRIGSVFLADIERTPADAGDDKPYLDVYLNVLDSAHPDYGLTMGVGAMYRGSLHVAVLEQDTGLLRSKSCDPAATTTCNDKIEWFNNMAYVDHVYKEDRSTPASLTASDVVNYRDVPYYGQVTDNDEVLDPTPASATPGEICRALPPAVPVP